MKLECALGDFYTACRAAGLAPKTRAWYAELLGDWARFVGARDFENPRLTREFLATLQARSERYLVHPRRRRTAGGLSPCTVRAYVRAIRRFFNWLEEERLIEDNPAKRLPMPRQPRHAPKAIAADDFRRMLQAAEDPRDRLLLLVLRDTGCRAGEVANLCLGEVDLSAGTALVRGKGNKERYVFLSPATCAHFQEWIALRGITDAGERLFVSKCGPFHAYTVYNLLRRLALRAGVTGRFNPHSLRHGFGRDWILSGGDLASLSEILGHTDLHTTRVYTQFAVAELKRLHAQHSPLARE